MQGLQKQVMMRNGDIKDLRKSDHRKMEMLHGIFTAISGMLVFTL